MSTRLVALAVISILACFSAAASESTPTVLEGGPGVALDDSSNLRPEVLALALEAYDQARREGLVRQPVLTIVDYELPSFEKRLWVIDMKSGQVLLEEWVAHGMGKPRGSGGDMEEALSFSNQSGTLKSSVGLFITAETYHGKHGYTLRLDGFEKGVNDNARERLIVLHGAPYVSSNRAEAHLIGRSWGCPVVREEIGHELIDLIKHGSVLWIYYPLEQWLETSEFLDETK